MTEHIKHGWLRGLLLLAPVGAVAALWYGYLNQPAQWPLNKIEIRGSFTHLDKTGLRQQVTDALEGGFFSVDMVAVRQALLARPWVREVGVRRIWPDTLRIHVTEQRPVARWRTADGKPALLNQAGGIFQPQAQPAMPHLPLLIGAASDVSAMMGFYRRIQAQAAQHQLSIAELHLNARQEWSMRFRNPLELMLGQHDPEQRWRDFMRIYPRLIAYGEPRRIDMRYEHGMAVRWQAEPRIQPNTKHRSGEVG